MFCPKCRYEYTFGVTICPDCQEPLVERLPEAEDTVGPDESWRPAGAVASGMKAEIARGALDSNDIPSEIISKAFGAHGRGLDFIRGPVFAAGEAELILVPGEHAEEAAVILRAVLGDDYIEVPDQ